MTTNARAGTVLFTGDKDRLAAFYKGITGWAVHADDDQVTVLVSGLVELVVHALPGEPPGQSTRPRQDAYVKPFFPVPSLDEARRRVADLGGRAGPADEDWKARGFKACEAVDPDGNRIQLREEAT